MGLRSYRRGALANLGIIVSDQTVGNVLKKHGLGPTDDRKRHVTWAQFIRRHKHVLWATDFFTTEVWTPTGLTTFYVLFFIDTEVSPKMSTAQRIPSLGRRLKFSPSKAGGRCDIVFRRPSPLEKPFT